MVGEKKNPSNAESVFSIIQQYRAVVLKVCDPWDSQDPFKSLRS